MHRTNLCTPSASKIWVSIYRLSDIWPTPQDRPNSRRIWTSGHFAIPKGRFRTRSWRILLRPPKAGRQNPGRNIRHLQRDNKIGEYMKIDVPLERANRIINSGQVILVTSGDDKAKNIITLAWSMPLSHKPPLMAICLTKKRFSYGLIKKSGEFAVNVPAIDLLEQVVYCASFIASSTKADDTGVLTGPTATSRSRFLPTNEL